MRKKRMPVLAAVIFVTVVGLIAVLTAVVQRYSPGKEWVDLKEYYNVASEEEMAVILDSQKTEGLCRYMDGHAYLDYGFVQEKLNQRFYWDANENILRYTTPTDVVSVNLGSSDYYVTKEKNTESYTIVRADGDAVYVAVDFVQKYTNIEFNLYENPNRIVITAAWGEVSVSTAKKNTEIRVKGGIKSDIVAELPKGETVLVVEQMDDWSLVCTEDGMIGYVKNKKLKAVQTKSISREFEEPEFTHLLKEEKINMVWHQVTNQTANSQVATVLQSTKGVNVISPTWFYLNDNEGNIKSLASSDYVKTCRANGVEVWALISDLENTEVSTAEVLSHTSSRDNLTRQLVAKAVEYDVDGINLDFERVSQEAAESYLQFIRELSVQCRKQGIRLSVDNYHYVSWSGTGYYNRAEQAVFADYIITMAYDEHTKNSKEEGSVASIGFVTEGVENTLAEVPAEQLILGMPFYTRVWECVPKNEDEVSDAELASPDYVPYTVRCFAEVTMSKAESYVTVNGATKVWSEEDGQNYVEYEKNGNTYKIWLEDAASLEKRLQLMKEKNLAGAAFWKVGQEQSSIWDTVIKYIN